MSALRVLHLTHAHPALGDVGGVELYVHALARARGDLVFTRDRAGPRGLRQQDGGGYPLWIAGVPSPKAPVFRDTWSAPEVAGMLWELLRAERPDLVHIHHLAHLGLDAARLCAEAGAAVAFTLHDPQLLCARGQLVNRALEVCPGPSPARCGACLAEHLRARPSLSAFAPLARRLGVDQALKRAIAAPPPGAGALVEIEARNAAGAAALRGANLVISPSQQLADRVRALGAREEIEVLDLPLVAPVQPAPEPPPGPLRLVFIGALIPTKGPQVLIEAFGALGEARAGATLTLWGPQVGYDGAPGFVSALLKQIQATPGARYAGVFDEAGRAAALHEADVLVAPSIWEENSPLTVREARAAGLRVIASAIGGIPELDPQARLVPPRDPRALTEAIRAEITLGRGRRAPAAYPMEAHLRALEALWADTLDKVKRAGGSGVLRPS
ncbi:glycosyltransferase [Myxococcota bacterium]|nr:glycosyltransferase [Myxococcota bacterium]